MDTTDRLAKAIGAAEKLMAPHSLPPWVPEAIENIALAATNFRHAQASLPPRADIKRDLQRIEDQIVRLERLLDDFRRRGAHVAYFNDVLFDVLGPRRELRARLAQARIAIGHWQGAMAGGGPSDAMLAFGAPDPELICAGGAAALTKIIRGREIPRRNEKSWALCEALLELSGAATSGRRGWNSADPLGRWEDYLTRVRDRPKVQQEDRASAGRMLANTAIELAGGPPEQRYWFEEKL
jgi:hypothetical protein